MCITCCHALEYAQALLGSQGSRGPLGPNLRPARPQTILRPRGFSARRCGSGGVSGNCRKSRHPAASRRRGQAEEGEFGGFLDSPASARHRQEREARHSKLTRALARSRETRCYYWKPDRLLSFLLIGECGALVAVSAPKRRECNPDKPGCTITAAQR